MKSILVIFNVTDAGLDDFVAANPVVHCLQPALICAVHEIDDLALVGREVARDRKSSPNISFIEFIAETEIHQRCFSRPQRPVQEVIIVELLEDGPARHRT